MAPCSAVLGTYPVSRYKKPISDSELGLTFVELLVCLSVVGMGLLAGLLFLPQLYQKNQLNVVVSDIKLAIHTAKIQALTQGESLVMIPSKSADDWSDGLLLFVDNINHQYRSKDQLRHAWHWDFPGVEVAWKGFQSDQYLVFSNDIRYSAANGYFVIKNRNHCVVRLIVNRIGRVRQVGSC